MPEKISEAASAYLQALDKKRKMANARGGQAAEDAIVAEQKKAARKLETAAGDRPTANEKPLKNEGPSKKDGPMKGADKESTPVGPDIQKGAKVKLNLKGNPMDPGLYKRNQGLKNALTGRRPKVSGKVAANAFPKKDSKTVKMNAVGKIDMKARG